MSNKSFKKMKEELNEINVPDVVDIKKNIDFSVLKDQEIIIKEKKFFSKTKCIFVLFSVMLFLPLLFIIDFNKDTPFVESVPEIELDSQDFYYLYIDINPSIELTVNLDDVVIKQRALNEDALIVLLDEDFTGTSVFTATNEIVSIADSCGFLENNTVNINTIFNDTEKDESKSIEIKTNVEVFIQDNDIKTEITIPNYSSLEIEAKKYNISVGKMELVLQCHELTNIDIEILINETIVYLKECIENYDKDLMNKVEEELTSDYLQQLNEYELNLEELNLIKSKLDNLSNEVSKDEVDNDLINLLLEDVNIKLSDEEKLIFDSIKSLNIQITKLNKKYLSLVQESMHEILNFKKNYKLNIRNSK